MSNPFFGKQKTTFVSAALPAPTGPVVVRMYKGSQAVAATAFQADAASLAPLGYVPVSQVWAAGSWGCGAFLLAAILCILVIGFLIFVYLLIVKPAGTLTVPYHLTPPPVQATQAPQP